MKINTQVMDALPPLDCSSAVINHQEEDDDEWVVVKKQKITILIPPPSPPSPSSPPCQQIVKETRPKPSKQEKRLVRSSRIRHKKTSAVAVKHKIGNKPHVGKPKLQQPQFSFHTIGVGNIGAVNVVNRQIRARNLERKLQGLGGLRRWLSLLGLDRFTAVFEREKLSKYQLVDLTTGKLKDMGMNAVGPRRKLVHAIDLLSQPYYSQVF